jgi:hypothetical protein
MWEGATEDAPPMTTALLPEVDAASPLDVIEQVVVANDWAFERTNDEEIAVQLPGRWSDFNFFVCWDRQVSAMQFTASLHLRVPDGKRAAAHELLALINEKVWMGHFAMWQEDGWLVFRHVLPLRGIAGLSTEQTEDLIHNALAECERFYPAFQYVIWAGKPASEALSLAIVETVGEA